MTTDDRADLIQKLDRLPLARGESIMSGGCVIPGDLLEKVRAAISLPAPQAQAVAEGWQDMHTLPQWKWSPFDAWVVHSEHGGRRECDCQINDHDEIIDRGGNNLNWSRQEDTGERITSKVTHWRPLLPAPLIAEQQKVTP